MLRIHLIAVSAFAASLLPASAFAEDCLTHDQAIAAAQASPPEASCVLQEWHGEPVEGEDATWRVYAYERFLACYKTESAHGTAGEYGVDTEKRRVPGGTRFTAIVTCDAVEWIETDCCYDPEHEKY